MPDNESGPGITAAEEQRGRQKAAESLRIVAYRYEHNVFFRADMESIPELLKLCVDLGWLPRRLVLDMTEQAKEAPAGLQYVRFAGSMRTLADLIAPPPSATDSTPVPQ